MSGRSIQSRFQSIEMEPMDDSSDNSNQTWLPDGFNSLQLRRSEMHELIMDYLLHEGFKEAAERFREEAGIEQNRSTQPSSIIADTNATRSTGDNNANGNLRTTSNDDSSIEVGNNSNNNNNNGNTSSAINNGNNFNRNSIHSSDYTIEHEILPCIIYPMNNTTSNSNSSNSRNGNYDRLTNNGTTAINAATTANNNHTDRNLSNHNKADWHYTSLASKAETPEMMDKRIEIRRFIEDGDILKGQSLINLHYPELLDNHRDVYFKLQQQHLIELIRQQKIDDVLAYVHDQLSVDELGDLTEMERTLALLAYEQPDKSPYAKLLHPSHRLQLASEINDIILQETLGSIEPTKPRLVTLLKLLVWTQNELERKKIQFPKMTDLFNGTILEPRN